MDRAKRIWAATVNFAISCAAICLLLSTATAVSQDKSRNNPNNAGDQPGNGMTTDVPGALPGIHLITPVPNGQWIHPAGDYANTRYSPLSIINTTNVQNLHMVSSFSVGIPHGFEGQPLVVGDTLYMVTPYPNNLIALDLTKPGFPQKWIYQPHPDNRSVGIACCDVVNRGADYADGKIIYNTLDAHTVAVDAKTGKLVWETQVGDTNLGETITALPWS